MSDPEEFEERVRRAARAAWSDSLFAGRDVHEGREYDLRVERRNEIVLIEATTGLKLDKFKSDAIKLRSRIAVESKRTDKMIKGYIVTDREPTSQQIEEYRKNFSDIQLITFDRLARMAIDADKYISMRKECRFGSTRSSDQKRYRFDEGKYVPQTIVRESDFSEMRATALLDQIVEGEVRRCAIVGGYGIGKSTCLMMLFKKMYTKYFKDSKSPLPILLNLDSHKGQVDPSEALVRHAREVGYEYPEDLVRVWRAGSVAIILDGFDELSSLSWSYNNIRLRDHRRTATTLIRRFLEESSEQVSIIVAGRDNYFDNMSELKDALGLGIDQVYRILDFDKPQVDDLLRKLGVSGSVPIWLPSRPLLISYFASNFSSADAAGSGTRSIASLSAGQGWRSIIPFLSERETRLDPRQVPHTVEKIYGALGSLSRLTSDGLGLFGIGEFDDIFRSITGAAPDEDAMQMMVRLAGTEQVGDGSAFRRFVDHDLADAMRFIDVREYVQNSYKMPQFLTVVKEKGSESSIHENYIEILRSALDDAVFSSKQLKAAYDVAARIPVTWLASELAIVVGMLSDFGGCIEVMGLRLIVSK